MKLKFKMEPRVFLDYPENGDIQVLGNSCVYFLIKFTSFHSRLLIDMTLNHLLFRIFSDHLLLSLSCTVNTFELVGSVNWRECMKGSSHDMV